MVMFLFPPDTPKMRQTDISFAITVILNALLPPKKHTTSTAPGGSSQHGAGGGPHVNKGIPQVALSGEFSRNASVSSHVRHSFHQPREIIQTVAFLGKICSLC